MKFDYIFHRLGSSKSPGGKHVTITVRETKTERSTPVNQSYPGKIFCNQMIGYEPSYSKNYNFFIIFSLIRW